MGLRNLNHYQIESRIGEGAFAEVYRAHDQRLERAVALKLLKPFWMNDEQAVSRFKQEAKALAKLHHPNIVPIYDVGEANGRVYLAQHLVEGQSLAQRLEKGPLLWPETLRIVNAVAKALDFAHQRGLVHRDVKPSNILLDQDRQIFLSDFGLVHTAEGSVTITSATGGMVGTPAYMAPEQWEGSQVGPAADVYALACVVVEMLTGERLFEGNTPMQIMRAHDKGPQFDPAKLAHLSAGSEPILRRAVAYDPAERYPSAVALVEALGRLESAPAVSEPKNTTRASRHSKNRVTLPAAKSVPPGRLWPMLTAALLLCGLTAAGLLWLMRPAVLALNAGATAPAQLAATRTEQSHKAARETAESTPTQAEAGVDKSTSLVMAVFGSTDLDITLEYPKSWRKSENNTIATFSPSIEGLSTNAFNDATMRIGQYEQSDAEIDDLLTKVLEIFPNNFETLAEGTISIASRSWNYTQIRFEDENLEEGIATIAVTDRNGVGYYLVAIAPATDWNSVQPVFQSMINSFRFTDSSVPSIPTSTPTPVPLTEGPTPHLKYEAPVLVGPEDGIIYEGVSEIVLTWDPVGDLTDDEQYAVRLMYPLNNQVDYGGANVRETHWMVPLQLYHQIDPSNYIYEWFVVVEHINEDGSGTAISPESKRRTFIWK